MENGTLYPLEIKLTATPKASAADSLGIVGKDRYVIPVSYL